MQRRKKYLSESCALKVAILLNQCFLTGFSVGVRVGLRVGLSVGVNV